jgi:alkanesulfonate monooxygenase SsuD/methylene tetrahydromethanopterin reductase-like flavin-dependent oxidoreductase (luciferase family)
MSGGKHSSWDDFVAIGRIAAGSPQTVADQIASWMEEAGCSRVNVVLEIGDMPEWKTMRNIDRFANEVIPRIRAKGSVADVTVSGGRESAGVS